MASLSDTLTVGLVLVLLFGSIALYLYTRIQQAEQKISLLESILLDLKMSSEVKSYSELPAHEPISANHTEAYAQHEDCYTEQIVHCFDKKELSPVLEEPLAEDTDVEQYKSIVADAINEDAVDKWNVMCCDQIAKRVTAYCTERGMSYGHLTRVAQQKIQRKRQ